jgi:hypothetical protein
MTAAALLDAYRARSYPAFVVRLPGGHWYCRGNQGRRPAAPHHRIDVRPYFGDCGRRYPTLGGIIAAFAAEFRVCIAEALQRHAGELHDDAIKGLDCGVTAADGTTAARDPQP